MTEFKIHFGEFYWGAFGEEFKLSEFNMLHMIQVYLLQL